MKKTVFVLISLILLFSFTGCGLVGASFYVEDDILHIDDPTFTPKMTLVGDEEKDITNDELWKKLVEAIDGKPIEDAPITAEELCECALTHLVRVRGNYSSGYYLTLHDHGVEISQYCKYRKCMELLGIVEVDEATMNELIGMLVEV